MSVTSRKMQEKWPSRLSEVLLIKRKRKRKRRAMFRTFFHVNEVLQGPVPHQNETLSCPARAGGDAQEMAPAISSRKWESTLAHPSAQQGLCSKLPWAPLVVTPWVTEPPIALHLCPTPACVFHQLATQPWGAQHTMFYCVNSTKAHHLKFSHGVHVVWIHKRRFSSSLLTMNRIMHLFNNQSCMRFNNFQFMFLVYLPVFKQYSMKRKYCSKEGFNYNYLFIASARVHKTAFYALMLTKVLDTSPDTLILFQSKWVGIKEISLGVHFYRSEQDYFNVNNYIVDIVAKQ